MKTILLCEIDLGENGKSASTPEEWVAYFRETQSRLRAHDETTYELEKIRVVGVRFEEGQK